MSLHLSFGDTPAYLGVHSMAGPLPKEALENSLWASHCSSLKVFPGKRHDDVSGFQPLTVALWAPRFHPVSAHRYYLDSPRCYTTCSARACLHSTFPHSSGPGCHIPALYTELLHHTFSNSLPKAPMAPSFHEQETKRGQKSSALELSTETVLAHTKEKYETKNQL